MLPCPQAGGENVGAFDDIFVGVSGNDQHNAADADVANSFYNMASDFYEYGWGDSFHFGYRHISQGHGQAIQNSQHLLAQKLQVGDMDRVADFGCGIGGPLRGVVRLTGANVTGITITSHMLRMLDVSVCNITDEGLRTICAGCPSLRSLKCELCRKIIRPVVRSDLLEYLVVSRCVCVPRIGCVEPLQCGWY